MDEEPSLPAGPLTTPKAFRRVTGAHTIVASVLLADLAGALLMVVIGTLIVPTLWWLLLTLVYLLHASLLLDIGLILLLLCLGIGFVRLGEPHGCSIPIICILLLTALLLILFLVKHEWIAIPASVIPAVPLELPNVYSPTISPGGAAIAAGLVVLAHLIVLSRYRAAKEQIPFARAHPDGNLWRLCEQAYGFYQRELARFNPPPITRLKTPPTFYYYERHPNGMHNVERDFYWSNGHLVINQAYLGPNREQADILLPLLARLLYDYNAPDSLVEQCIQLKDIGDKKWFTSWMLAVPLIAIAKCEQRWNAMEREHVLDRDHFAYLLGEGKRLCKLLRSILREKRQHNEPDTSLPTLIERIDHLESLIGREARQVKVLRDALPPTSDASK